MTTEIITSPEVDEGVITTEVADIDEGQDDDNLRHIVRPMDNGNPLFYQYNKHPTAQEIIDIAAVRGLKVKALCGREWVPGRSVEDRDTCNSCVEIAGMIRGGTIE